MAKVIYVDISRQKLLLAENNKVVSQYDCITGAAKTQTPIGVFKITKREVQHTSSEFHVEMPFSLFFIQARGIAIHQSPWAKTRSYAKYLGVGDPGSHGCVGLSDDGAAKAVFDWAPLNTPVSIHEHAPVH